MLTSISVPKRLKLVSIFFMRGAHIWSFFYLEITKKNRFDIGKIFGFEFWDLFFVF